MEKQVIFLNHWDKILVPIGGYTNYTNFHYFRFARIEKNYAGIHKLQIKLVDLPELLRHQFPISCISYDKDANHGSNFEGMSRHLDDM